MAKGGINDLKRKNGSRNIFSFIHKKNKTLPITTSSITVPVRGKSRQKHIEQQKAWPILFLSDWMKAAFEPPYNGFFLACWSQTWWVGSSQSYTATLLGSLPSSGTNHARKPGNHFPLLPSRRWRKGTVPSTSIGTSSPTYTWMAWWRMCK